MLVALCGAIGSGKTTVSGILRQAYNYEVLSFAAPIKAALRERIGNVDLDDQTVKATYFPQIGCTPRRFMQVYGTAMRSIDRDYFVTQMQQAIDKLGHSRVVIADTRYLNEFDFVWRRGGVVVRVVRPGVAGKADHDSESFFDKIEPDVVIINDSTLSALEKAVPLSLRF